MSIKRKHRHCWTSLAAPMAALVSMAAHAAPLPPPPASPAPVVDYEYDAKGNPTKVIKAKGVSGFGFTTANSYDPLDRVKASTDARSGVTTLGYDGQDQLKQVQDPRNLLTAYQRNGLGDLTQLNSPDTGIANSTYDAAGNLLTRTDSRGVLATHAYDALNRLTSTVYSQSGQASLNYTWTYDQSGGDFGYGVGRLTTATGTSGNTKYGYDAQGRVITTIQTVGTMVHTTRFGYDSAGHITRITYPSGRVLTIVYDNGLPASMSLAKDAASAAQPLISQIQWEPFGGVRSWLMHMTSGTKLQERVHDSYGRLVRYPLGGYVRDLTYDAADRIVSYTHLDADTGLATAGAQALNQSFSYDELGRLTGVITPSASWTIGYDANGNRTGVTLNGTARSYTTETTSNRLSQISNPTRSFGYDAAGNTLSDNGSAYTATYRLDNRLGSLTQGAYTTTYRYDAGGQRVHKQHSAGMRYFAYDLQGQLLGEYYATGPSQEYVWLGDLPVAMLNGGTATAPEILYAYADHLNAPRLLVDQNNAIRWRWISEPFGSTAAETAPTGLAPIVFNLRFPGQFFDSESGLHYNYFRDYDGTTGRYAQSDPIGLHGGINTYAYVGANPTDSFDPQGLQANCVASPFGVVCQRTPPIYIDQDYPPGVGPNRSTGTSSSSSASSTSKKGECDCSHYPSRTQAYFNAAAVANISSDWYMVDWDAYNKPRTRSAQIEYTKFRQRIGKEPYGWRSPQGGELVEHPADDDHPCPHFHAKPNLAAKSIQFPYDPAKP
ncbi:RHS repeat domain-containing protein [Roseateles aquatilis]|nr:RHS repeat-associated core domain-containing protein [Roseateles aquatilis]